MNQLIIKDVYGNMGQYMGQYDRLAKFRVGTLFIDKMNNRYKYVGIKFFPKAPLLYTWLPCLIKFDLKVKNIEPELDLEKVE